ncbi:hypothetical protein Avbf_12563, partial [Armadillidium vulgare]
MDIKYEEEFKIELLESTEEEEEDKKINVHLEQLLVEEIQERDCIGSIDMKSEIEVKEEPFDIVEEEAANDELERDCYGSIDMKSEIEVKEEPFDFEEEETANDELSDKICELDQNQVRIKC